MKAKVLGFKRSKGNFTNQDTGLIIEYDNVQFFVSKKLLDPGSFGDEVYTVVVPFKALMVPYDDCVDFVDQICSFEVESLDRQRRIYKASEVSICQIN